MRILVLSDTHGDFNRMMKAVTEQPNAEVIIHCGDGEEQVEYLKQNFKDKMVVGVRGNCDWGSMLPATETLRINGKTIFITHGHLYNAREAKADILCFGHTHSALSMYEDGLYVLNPGSCGGYMASYGTIDITDKGEIITNTVAVK